jgi:hypothetical protein
MSGAAALRLVSPAADSGVRAQKVSATLLDWLTRSALAPEQSSAQDAAVSR